MAAAKLPQSQVPRLSSQPHDVNNQAGDTGIVKMNMLKKNVQNDDARIMFWRAYQHALQDATS